MGTLFLSPPSFDGFDGGAGSRYQAKREVTSFWYPTWLAQPAALVPDGKLLDCPPHNIGVQECLAEAKKHKGADEGVIEKNTNYHFNALNHQFLLIFLFNYTLLLTKPI